MPILKVKRNGLWEEIAGTSGHTHTIGDITNFPASLPADGGNADTVGGKSADAFADAASFEQFKADTNEALAEKQPKGDYALKIEIPSTEGLATETYVDTKVAGLVDSAPETLDTLNELAAALGDDPNFATTIATQIGNKVDKEEGKGLSTNDYTTEEKTKLASIAEGAEANVQSDWNVTDETSDAFIKNKPVPDSTLTVEGAAADAKAVGDAIKAPKDYILLVDQANGKKYRIYMSDGNLVSEREFDPSTDLVDFEYADNGDSTYTITSWKGTYNGQPSTEMIIPNQPSIIV